MRWTPFLLALLLAGCATKAPLSGTATSTALPLQALPLNATAGNATHFLRSDTAHLLLAPLTNLTAPRGNETLIATKAAASGPQTFTWNFTVQKAANVTGAHTHAWLRLTQSVAQSGANNDAGCTLALSVVVRHNHTDAGYAGGCGSAGFGILMPGDHLLEFAAGPGSLVTRVLAGDNVFVQLTLAVELTGLGPTAFLVGGSAERDSWVRLDGLREPVRT